MSRDLKELMELLAEEESKQEETKDSVRREVRAYIEKTGIESGDVKVPTYLIYYHFCDWVNNSWYTRLGRTEFFRQFNKLFDPARSGKQRYYWLNDALPSDDEYKAKAKAHKNVKSRGKYNVKKES